MVNWLRRGWLGYVGLRSFGNGRLQAWWKVLGYKFGYTAWASPKRWDWAPPADQWG